MTQLDASNDEIQNEKKNTRCNKRTNDIKDRPIGNNKKTKII